MFAKFFKFLFIGFLFAYSAFFDAIADEYSHGGFVLGFSGNTVLRSEKFTNSGYFTTANVQLNGSEKFDQKFDLTGFSASVGWRFFSDMVVGIDTGYRNLDFKTTKLTDPEQYIHTEIMHVALSIEKYFVFNNGFDIFLGSYFGASDLIISGKVNTDSSSYFLDDNHSKPIFGFRLGLGRNITCNSAAFIGYLFTALHDTKGLDVVAMKNVIALSDFKYKTHALELSLRFSL